MATITRGAICKTRELWPASFVSQLCFDPSIFSRVAVLLIAPNIGMRYTLVPASLSTPTVEDEKRTRAHSVPVDDASESIRAWLDAEVKAGFGAKARGLSLMLS